MYNLPEGENDRNRLLIPSLFVSQLSTRPAGILTGFILMDIAQTFGTTVGIVGQIVTAASLAGMIIAPFLAVLSIKYKPRTLLLTGIVLIAVSSLGCSFAFNYASMLLFYSLSGLGAAMVTPMIMTIIGENIPEEKRSGVIGQILASTPILSTLTGLTITLIVSRGWKTAYLFYVFPITSISLVLTILGLRKTTASDSRRRTSMSIRGGFKRILGYGSAVACLLGAALTMMLWGGIMWYFISFYRQFWVLPTESVGVIWSANTFVHVIGSMLCGKVVPKVGRKRLTDLSVLCVGVLTILYTHAPNYYVSILSNLIISILLAFWASSSSDLALAQVPEYSGAMMSLNSGSSRLGSALGSAVGGLVLTVGDYGLLGLVMGFTGIIAFLVIFLFARDPVHIATTKHLTQ